jgi:hypothetical protein
MFVEERCLRGLKAYIFLGDVLSCVISEPLSVAVTYYHVLWKSVKLFQMLKLGWGGVGVDGRW